MNRTNEIYKAAREYCKNNIPVLQEMHSTISTAFEAGAEYTDKHPSRKMMLKVWEIAMAAAVDQINGKIAYLKTGNEIVAYIRERLKS